MVGLLKNCTYSSDGLDNHGVLAGIFLTTSLFQTILAFGLYRGKVIRGQIQSHCQGRENVASPRHHPLALPDCHCGCPVSPNQLSKSHS